MSEKEELIRIHDERLAIFEFGRLTERMIIDKEFEDIRLDFRNPTESPDALLYIKFKDGELQFNVEFEGYSSNAKSHLKKDPDFLEKCHLVICTQHDYKDSPLPVLETCYGHWKIFFPRESTEGSLYELVRKIK